jgi:hypothetical protein
MNTYTANFKSGTISKNFKRSDFTHAWKVMGENDGVEYLLGEGFTTNQKDAEKRAQSVINFEGYGKAEIVKVK